MKPRVILVVMLIAVMLAIITASYSSGKGQSGVTSGKTAPGTTTQQPKPQPTGTVSDLSVDKVWLDDQCRINIKLKNAGEYTMSDKEHSQGMVRVYFGKSHEDFYFSKTSLKKKLAVDPNGALKKPGSTLSYNTKIGLKERIRVSAYVGVMNKIAKADKQKGKSLTLTPQCAAALAPEKLEKGRERQDAGTTSTVQRAVQALETTEPQPDMKISKKPREFPRPDLENVTTMELMDGGIRITSPGADDVYHPGEHIAVVYEITGDTEGVEELRQELITDDLEEILRTLSYIEPNGHSDLEIPSGIRNGNYRVLLGVSRGFPEDGRWGCSDVFRIQGEVTDAGGDLPSFEVHVTSPGEGEAWPRGHFKEIRWRMHPDMGSEYLVSWWSVYIMQGERVLHEYPGSSLTSYDSARGEFVKTIALPRDFDHHGTGFKVRVRGREGPITGDSGSFTIPEKSIYVIHPSFRFPGGPPYCRGKTMLIQWGVVGEWLEGVDAFLYRGGGRGIEIFNNEAADTSSTGIHWRVPIHASSHSTTIMEGFKIRVQSHSDPSIYGESQTFALENPVITVRNPVGGRHYTLGDPVPIEWNHTCAAGQVHIDVIDSTGASTRIATVNTSDGSYSWRAGIIERRGEYYRGAWGAPDDGAPVERESITGENLRIRVTSEYSDMLYGESHPFHISR